MTLEHGFAEVRRERPEDVAAIAHVNDAAFGQPDESRIIEAVRDAGHPAISLVATPTGSVVGHILFTPVDLESSGPPVTVFGLGPMAVLPAWQRRGIGSRLVESGLRECSDRGCTAVVVVGHPQFYPRFGFRPARGLGLRVRIRCARRSVHGGRTDPRRARLDGADLFDTFVNSGPDRRALCAVAGSRSARAQIGRSVRE